VPKRTPSPFLFKNLQQRQEEERQLFMSKTLPLERAVPLLQGVVRRTAVRHVASYWHACRDDVRGRIPRQLQNLPKAPGGVRTAARVGHRGGQPRPGEDNIVGLLGAVSRLQAAVRAKLSLMMFASGRLWFAETAAELARRQQQQQQHTRGIGGGGGPLHAMLVELLLEDGGMVRKEQLPLPSLSVIEEDGLFHQGSVGSFKAFGAPTQQSNLPHSMLGLLYWSTSWDEEDRSGGARNAVTRQPSDAYSHLPVISPDSTRTTGVMSPVHRVDSPSSPLWGFAIRDPKSPPRQKFLCADGEGSGSLVRTQDSWESLDSKTGAADSVATSKSLRELSQDFRDTQRRSKTYRVGRPLGPADQDRHADGPHLHVPGDAPDADTAGHSAKELVEEGALYAITAPQEPRGHGVARHVTNKLPDVPKAMLELAASRRLQASVRMHLANRVLAKVFHIRALRFRAALRIQTWVLAVQSRRVARVIREAFLLEQHMQKSARKIQTVLARGPAARRRVALLRRWRKLGLSQADMWREQVRYSRSLYVSRGHRERFRGLAAVLQAAARRKVLMLKYQKYVRKRSQMSDEELLFENLRLNKVLDHAYWRDFGPSDWKRKGPLKEQGRDGSKKRGAGQWWLHYSAGSESRPATSKTGKTGSEVDYAIPAAVPPPPVHHPVGHHPRAHVPLHHAARVPRPGLPPSRPPPSNIGDEAAVARLPGSPRRSQFTPRSRVHPAMSPSAADHPPSRGHGEKVVFRLPYQTPRDDLRPEASPAATLGHEMSRASPLGLTHTMHSPPASGSPSRHRARQPWPKRPEEGVFDASEVTLLPQIASPGTPLGGLGSAVRMHSASGTDVGGLSVVGEVSHEESMAQMEASMMSKASNSAGVGGISAPLPILSSALRYTVGAYARKLEDVHHQFERRMHSEELVQDSSSPRAPA